MTTTISLYYNSLFVNFLGKIIALILKENWLILIHQTTIRTEVHQSDFDWPHDTIEN